MLQVDSDISFSLLVADSRATDKLIDVDHMNNQWQLPSPGWQPLHRQAANSPQATYGILSPRTARPPPPAPVDDHHHHAHTSHQYDAYASPNDSFRGYGYSHDRTGENQHPSYYNSPPQWSYQQPSYPKQASELGLGIDPLPLPHVVAPPHAPAGVEDDLYEARMLQEALTTPHYPRHNQGIYQHHHALPPQQQQHHHQQQQQHIYSQSPFVSAMMDVSGHHGYSASLYHARPTAIPSVSEPSNPSDSETTSERTATGKRKRRGEAAPRLCRVDGCSKGIRSRGLCKAHGGGRRCMTPGCTTSDQGGGHCVLHGGGRRCTVGECTKSAQWKGLCKMHGGARRCRYENCTKNGQVKQGYCRAHHNLISKQRAEQEDKQV